jgi:hypothetical protein
MIDDQKLDASPLTVHELVKGPQGTRRGLADGTQVRLGVLLSNTRSRRGKLTPDKLAALAGLGLEWAAA